MAHAVRAELGYEKTEKPGVVILRIRRQEAVVRMARWSGLLLLTVVATWAGYLVDESNRHHTAWSLLSGGVGAVVLIAYAVWPKKIHHTVVELGRDTLTVAGRSYAKRDICNLVVRSPRGEVIYATSAWSHASQTFFAELSAKQQYAVAFDYGVKTMIMAGQLTAPQAERVGSEVATWLEA